MTHLLKDTFYKEKLYQYSVSSFSLVQEQQTKTKEHKQPLSDEILKKSLQTYAKTAEGPHYNYLSFVCNNQDLTTLLVFLNRQSDKGINRFKHLQHVDVSHNQLKSLKLDLKYLITLKASHNRLTKLLDLKSVPLQLLEVDCSFNEIETIPDLSQHRFLTKLDISSNRIELIQGVKRLPNLKELYLANNKIEKIEELEGMHLTDLDLFGNNIQHLEGLTHLAELRKLDISQNFISKLNGIIDLLNLRDLRIANNKLSRIKELQFLENLVFLSVLDLCYNPIQSKRYYRWQTLYKLPGLRNLDGVTVTPEDIVKAENLYAMDLEDRKRIFKDILPDEEFIDRRIHLSEVFIIVNKLIEPETESDNENQDFIDTYDQQGKMLKNANKSQTSMKSLSEMYHSNKSLHDRQNYDSIQ